MTEPTSLRTKKVTPEGELKPAHVVRYGAIAASIWRRQSPNGFPFFDFSLSRSYRSMSTGKEGYSTNFFDRNRDDLEKAISGATAWIASQAEGTAPSNAV